MEAVTTELLAGSPIPHVLIGSDERIEAINSAAAQLFGTGAFGRHYITILRQPSVLDQVEAVLAGRENRVTAPFVSTGAGSDTHWRATVASVKLGNARYGALISFEDLTAETGAEQVRRDFVANVSHELRTPLTSLLGFVETLRGAAAEDPVARERFLGIMAQEARRMNRLVDDLLWLSRVEQNERVRPTGTVDTAALVRETAQTLKPLADGVDVAVEVIVDDAAPAVSGDRDQLAQVLSNLVENALKYGRSGGIVRLTQSHVAREPTLRGPAIRIDIADRGQGIDPVHIPRLTERFYRVDPHRSRELGGTGLGLAIVKHIVSRHRGRLRIVSEPGVGSIFTVLLPLEADCH